MGCGHSTFLMSEAIAAEAATGYAPDYSCIEPYRQPYLQSPPPEVSRFLETPLQALPLETFDALEAGDLLFIDSSHVMMRGSDTVHEMLEIFPRLKPGVMVHIHDIFLPYDYPEEWFTQARFFWAEQYMLDAFLRGNCGFEVRFPLHQLYRERRAELQALFPLLADPAHRPSAYWIEVV